MGNLGQRLKQEREARGVSLEEIALRTRIGVRLLKAIEAEDFDQLPGGIFNKSFIQQYAQYLGLDEKQAARDYLLATAASREAPPSLPNPAQGPSVDRSRVALTVALGAVAVFLIALLGWIMVPGSGPPANAEIAAVDSPAAPSPEIASGADFPAQPAPPPSPELLASEPYAAGQEQTSSGAIETSAALLRRAVDTAPTAAELLSEGSRQDRLEGELPEELLLEINARSTVWISITADGERAWQGTMQPNQSREVQAVETIRLTVGNAGGVELTLNGKDLGSLGGEGEVKTVTLAARALHEAVP